MHAGVDLQLALKLHYKFIREMISLKGYKDENINAEIPISNVNRMEKLVCCSQNSEPAAN